MHYLCAVFQDEDSHRSIDDLMSPYYEELTCEPHISMTYEESMEKIRSFLKNHPDGEYAGFTDDQLWKHWYNDRLHDLEGNIYSTSNPQGYYDYYVDKPTDYNSVLRLKDSGKLVNSAIFADVDFSFPQDVYDEIIKRIPDDNPNEFGGVVFDEQNHVVAAEIRKYGIYYPFTTTSVVSPGGVWYHNPFEDDDEWYDNYEKNILSKVKPEWRITVVECHI